MTETIARRLSYLLDSTRGLILVAIALVSMTTVLFGTLSGPMAEWGVKDLTVRVLGMRLVEAEREGRIVMLYHCIAMAVIAIEVYLITELIPMKGHHRATVNGTITLGYITSLVFGLAFGYFGHSFLFHGIFIFGQSLVFFSGMMLAAALWPWSKEYRTHAPDRAHTRGGIDLERGAFFALAVATLISAGFGAVAGSYSGNGFESFLAEDVVREPDKAPLQLAVIGHLHIMLALVAVAIALIVGRWLSFSGRLHRAAMPLMISGTLVLSLGAWLVVPFELIAHYIIYAGSSLVMVGALLLVIFGFRKLIHEGLEARGLRRAGLRQRLVALIHDPLKFGALWQMVFMNFTVSGVGIFMAVELDKIIRRWPWREERITLTGHWHILAGIVATIILLYFADMMGLKGRARQWFGWLVILGSDVAFGAVTLFSLKRLFVSESAQQPVVDWTMLLADLGLGTVLVALAALVVWCLTDLFLERGRWTRERRAAPSLAVLVALLVAGGALGARAATADLPTFETGGDSEAWARIPAGEFLMGQHDHETVVDHDYDVMVRPVTNGQYARYLNEALSAGTIGVADGAVMGYYPGDLFHGYKHEERVDPGDKLHLLLSANDARVVFDGAVFSAERGYEEHPAVYVTWFGAKAFADFYGWRLPTEIEWEKAARGTDGRPYPWGDTLTRANANYYQSRDPFEGTPGVAGGTTPVGFYDGGIHDGYQTVDAPSPYGAYDMAGNVWQWTADIYEGVHYRYLRGGSKSDHPRDLRSWVRNSARPDYASPGVGFRCVR